MYIGRFITMHYAISTRIHFFVFFINVSLVVSINYQLGVLRGDWQDWEKKRDQTQKSLYFGESKKNHNIVDDEKEKLWYFT